MVKEIGQAEVQIPDGYVGELKQRMNQATLSRVQII